MITNYIKLAKQRLKKSLGFVIRLGKKLFSWLLELTIWASCLAWISSDCFESFSSLSDVWIDQPLTLYRDVTTTRKPGSDFDWSHSFAWYSADRIGGMLVEFKHFDNLYRKQQNCPGLRTELLNWTVNEEFWGFRSDFVYEKFPRLISCCQSTFLLFSLSKV